MKVTSLLVIGLFASACSGIEPLTETSTELITIESVDLPGALWDPFMPPLADGRPVSVGGSLTIPPTDSPVPAVVIAHGCGGVGGAERGWVDDLAAEGIATLVLDSFGGRGLSDVCDGRQTVNVASIIVDVFRAADALSEHEYIDGSRIAVMGMSFGGRTALWSAVTRFQDEYEGRPFQAHIAFYPSTCFIRLQDEHLVSDGPIRIFHGTADDWTPLEPCQDLIDRLTSHGVDARLFAYPDAPHSFDNAELGWAQIHLELQTPSPRSCSFVERDGVIIDPDTGNVAGVGSTCVELGVHYGYDRDAREAAKAELIRFLRGTFGTG